MYIKKSLIKRPFTSRRLNSKLLIVMNSWKIVQKKKNNNKKGCKLERSFAKFIYCIYETIQTIQYSIYTIHGKKINNHKLCWIHIKNGGNFDKHYIQ